MKHGETCLALSDTREGSVIRLQRCTLHDVQQVCLSTIDNPYTHLATSEMWCWSGGREILRQLSLCCSIVYYYNGTQRYEQFLQIGRLYRTLILLGLALFQTPLYLWSSWCYIYVVRKIFQLLHFLYLLVSWAWWDWRLTWLTNHCLSVLWHCWLGHVSRKIVSEMTYNVSSGR